MEKTKFYKIKLMWFHDFNGDTEERYETVYTTGESMSEAVAKVEHEFGDDLMEIHLIEEVGYNLLFESDIIAEANGEEI